MKNHLLYTLALPIVLFIFSCSHMPFLNPEQGPESALNQDLSSPLDAPAPEIARSDTGSASETDPEAADLPGNVVDETAVSDEEVLPAGCQEGDTECITLAELALANKEAQMILDESLDFCEVSQSFWQKGELDNALEALDKAYSLIFEVDTRQDPKLIQQKEDLRFLISKRILEIYASRNIVVNGDHDEIPMQQNKHVEAELRLFSVGSERNWFKQSYQRSGQYRPYILNALKEAGLPEELSWLPLIESGYKVKALSSARALGLWQFIPSTGYKFGLKRTNYIDERIDFEKATHAAIAYLKELHNIFGDWATVLAAYNCGEGRVLRVIRTQNVNYLDNFWDLYQRLPRETARYVPRFFATLHMVKNPEQYGLDKIVVDSALAYDTIEINREAHLNEISKILNLSLSELETLNPELRYHILPPELYTLRVPVGKADIVLANLDSIPTCTLPQRTFSYHRVRPGETLASIARRYRISIAGIMQANNLRNSHFIRAGRNLKIPAGGKSAVVTTVSTKTQPAGFSGSHAVIKGDSLWNIAQRYQCTVKQISDMNNLSSSRLHIGQKLKIPGYKPDPLPDANELRTYFVKRGDSPYTIALKYTMPLESFLSINRLTPRSKIYPGQKLFIK